MTITWKKTALAACLLLLGWNAQAQEAPKAKSLSKKDMQARIATLEQENAGIKQEYASTKEALSAANTELNSLKTDMISLKEKATRMEAIVKSMQQKAVKEPIANNGSGITVSPESAKTIDALKSTSIVFAETTFNFGKVKEGEKVVHIYAFKNTGDFPLTITAAKGSCGCTVPEFSKEPIPPGASGEIKVQFDSNGKNGTQSKSVTITANTTPAETVIIIAGEVEKKG